MICYLDNDAACKLTGYDLYDKFLAEYGLVPLRVRRLGTLSDVFELREATLSKRLKDQAHRVLMLAVIKATHPLTLSDSIRKLVTRLIRQPRIDAGEALLIASAVGDAKGIFVTGDKKALLALAQSGPLSDLAKSMAGRCLHVEQIIYALGIRHGLSVVRKAILSREPGIDINLHNIMRDPETISDADAFAMLKASIDSLRNQTGQLLM